MLSWTVSMTDTAGTTQPSMPRSLSEEGWDGTHCYSPGGCSKPPLRMGCSYMAAPVHDEASLKLRSVYLEPRVLVLAGSFTDSTLSPSCDKCKLSFLSTDIANETYLLGPRCSRMFRAAGRLVALQLRAAGAARTMASTSGILGNLMMPRVAPHVHTMRVCSGAGQHNTPTAAAVTAAAKSAAGEPLVQLAC
jgi:hypothetical protein